jgi:hypothetical protein
MTTHFQQALRYNPMNSSVIRKLRKVEAETHERNMSRRDPEDQPKYSMLYTLYTWIFHCRRSVLKMFFQEDEPKKVLEIELPEPEYPWLCVFADDEDVTEVINEKLLSHVKLSRELLEAVTGLRGVSWSYMDSRTFEVVPIVSPEQVKDEGAGTEPASDAVPDT